ncbi:hypothetical protein M408DRAFT_169467 [Serendipita vermifera MAFF 305830]|uniref:F-box domain-containing protein n=1 Tax=Serendipita vermifera MAFF 305830 TaxID=933852 RepID=A0A0C3B7D0_SERVB|nr:hypothetical protein M408DRAFT_169467 [Serendipita vermifera MAFF 305830]
MANKRIHAVFSAQELMPLEIWTQCLFEACHGPNYMAKLLNLTTVSKKWNEVIMRIQTLWAYINVNESDEDSEATIALFLHLSGKTQLTLAISMPLSGHWSAILNLLYPHKARIRNIILISTKDTPMSCYQYKSTSDSGDSEPGWVLNRVIEELDLFAMKQKFNITSDIPLQPEMLLPSSVQLPSGNWLILSASFGTTSLKKRGRRFIKPHQIALSIVNLPDIGRYSSTLGHLEHLHIVSETHDYVKAPPTYVDSTISLRFPLLTTLQYHARFQPALSQLITARSRLQYLDIQIGILDVIGVIDALEVATSLRGFTLTLLILEYDLDASGKKRPYYPRNITNTISKKRTPSWCLINVEKFKCEIKHYEGKEVPGTLHVDYLWRVFHAIFPNLRHLVWNLPMQSRTLLTSLSRQKQLTHFESMAVPPSSYNQGTRVTLSSLESLSVNDARIFDGVGISNLSHLSMRWYDEFEIPAGIGLMQLQSLTIATGNNVKRPVKISPKDFPLLQSISITFHGPRSSFNLPDLPNLIEVRISTRFPAFTQGIKLCTSLMCEPEICPKLERIHLDSFIQWDILFVLLKRRNFGRSPAISKIRELGLPQVAPRFRSVLTSLLQQQEAPSDLIFYRVLEELPIWQAQRRLLDENIAGCVHCVYMGTPGCQEPVKPPRFPFEYEKDNRKDQNSSIVELYELFSVPEWGASGKTPITCSVHDQGWMEKCTGDVLMWEIMAREWSKLHHRTFMCHKRPSANLVTSDHDIIVEECSRGMDLESLLTELQSITKSCAGAPYDNNSVEKLVDTVRGCLSAGRKGPVHNGQRRKRRA